MTENLSRAKGMVYGLAIGDALVRVEAEMRKDSILAELL